MKRGDFIFNILRVPVDFMMLIGAGIVAYVLRTQVLDVIRPVLFGPELPFARFFWMTTAASALFVLVYAASGLYAMKLRMTVPQEATRILVASSAATMVIILFIFIRAEAFNSRFLVLGYWLLAMFMVIIGRICIRAIFRRLTVKCGFGTHRILLIGNDGVTEQLETTMHNDPALGYRIIKKLTDPDLDEVKQEADAHRIDEVILATPDYPADRIVQLVDFCHEEHIVFRFVPNIYRTLTTNYDVDAIGRVPLVQLKRTSLDGWGRVFKRVFDMIGSAAALTVLAPMFAIVAFAIKWETYGPVFVRLKRVSRGREFDLLKFRSMVAIDPDGTAHSLNPYFRSLGNDRKQAGPLWKMKNDPRITGVGKFIRKTRIDELPQFINVLKGEMSIVGPRPHQSDEIARYRKHHKKVLAIKAGATGLVQASGASDMPFEEEVALDTFYIENWSLMLDIRISIKTALRMFRDRSAA